MPQVTVYVREDDLGKWKSIKKKSEWLSEHLNAYEVTSQPNVVNVIDTEGAEKSSNVRPVIKTPEDALEAIESIQETATRAFMGEEIKFCKNGHPMNKYGDRCLDKKCKYA